MGQGSVGGDALQASAQFAANRREVGRTEIGELLAFDVAPDQFDGIEIGRVGGQLFHRQPVALGVEMRLHQFAFVGRQAVPDQQTLAARPFLFERLQKADQAGGVVAAGSGLEEQPTAFAIPALAERSGDGKFLPVEGMHDHRRLARRSPSAADRRLLGHAAFIHEDYPAALAPGFFLMAGHFSAIHPRTAPGFCSLARRAGRCKDQPIRWSKRQT